MVHLEYMPVEELKPAPRNPKRHAPGALATSIDRFGYVEPIVVDERTGLLVAGHGRRETLLAMRKAGQQAPSGIRDESGQWLVPVVRGWASRSDREAEAYLIASNRHVELGGWDEGALATLLQEIGELAGTGFSEADVKDLLDRSTKPVGGETDPDEVPEVGEVWVQPGDLFDLGRHRLLCGDSTKPEEVDRLMAGARAQFVFTDPPWNVDYGDRHGRRPIANDALGSAFPAFCEAFSREIHRVLLPGGALYLVMGTQEWPTIDAALRNAGFHWSSTLVWVKDSAVMARKDYHTRFEPLWYGWAGDAARLHPVTDRKQTDVWEIARPKKSEEHPTMKPVELVVRALRNSSSYGDAVFEPFSGSGTTLIACEELSRECRAIEIDPRYVQVAIERWQKFTGRKATKVSP